MNQTERELLQKLDFMILTASDEDLKKIQEIDLKTQMDGLSFYDVFVNSKFLANKIITQKTQEYRK
ncbi:MAG: hypothetical protein OEM18_05780 [Nitrosopumilus sp.]|jgi:hypothetical protein|nr:hypothetical protein [Nitrosopumilus sp.]MDH3502654.1 hypothetical protein [Nitrosopumilus sp.]